jgi:hypothetical protein
MINKAIVILCASASLSGCAFFSAPQFDPPLDVESLEPEVWVHQGNWRAFGAADAQWDFVKANVDGFQFFIDSLSKAKPGELDSLARIFAENDIDVSVELGGILTLYPMDDNVGEETFRIESEKLQPLKEAGIELDYINLDGPIRRALNDPLNKGIDPLPSLEMAADELIDYMRLMRKEFPEAEFFLLSNFPNWGWKDGPSYTRIRGEYQGWGDYQTVLETVTRKTREAGIPIRGVTIDFPYDYAMAEVRHKNLPDPSQVDWFSRIRELEIYAKSLGLEVNIIFNSQHGGQTSNEAFCEETIIFVNTYRKFGGKPKRYIIETWYKHPNKVAPETEPYTMTWLAKEAIQNVKRTGK